MLGTISGLGSYIGHHLKWLSHRIKGGGSSTTAIMGSVVATSILDSIVAASIMDPTVATSTAVSSHYLTGRHWDWVYYLVKVINILPVARQATGKTQSIVKAVLILCIWDSIKVHGFSSSCWGQSQHRGRGLSRWAIISVLKVGSVCIVCKIFSKHIYLFTSTCIVIVINFVGKSKCQLFHFWRNELPK